MLQTRMNQPSSLMEDLCREVEELELIRRDVQEQVKKVKAAGEKIGIQVNQWLKAANKICVTVQSNWLGYEKVDSTFLKRLLCFNHPSKKSEEDVLEMKTRVSDLVAEGKSILCVHFLSDTAGIELMWRNDFVEFRSRKYAFDNIMEGLKDEDVDMIGVFGMGGIGKTKLVVEIGKRAKDENLFGQVVVTTVSRNFNKDIQGNETENERSKKLREKILKESKILVILDDVWEKIDMERIGIPSQSDHKGCKIVLTTRRENVCKEMGCKFFVHLDVIDEEDANALFGLFSGLGRRPRLNVCKTAKNIVRECAGLPLALVTVGSALRDKSLEDYQDAARKLSNSNFANIESVERDLYASLKLSYDYLEDEDTRKCFLLCSLYPEDDNIMVEDLTRYAYGLWLFENVQSFDETRQKIYASIKTLEDACLLVHDYEHNQFTVSVKMHDMVRDVALWIIANSEAPFLLPTSLKEFRKKDMMYGKAIAIALRSQNLTGPLLPKLEYSNLKLLIMRISPTAFPGDLLTMATGLQVLVLLVGTRVEQINLDISTPVSLQYLVNLKTLHLGRNLRNMSIIRKLKNLEILELSFPKVEKVLPQWIGELCNLKVLDLSECHDLELIPWNSLSRLVKLEELYTPINHATNKWSHTFLSHLRSLPRLTVLTGWFTTSRSYISYWNTNMLKTFRRSRILGLDDLNVVSLKNFEQLWPGIEYLVIFRGPMQGIKNMCPQLDNAGFENLRELQLWDSESVEYIIDTTKGYELRKAKVLCKLVRLSLSRMTQLCTMCYGPLPLSLLENLRDANFMECPRIKNIFPDMLLITPRLEQLEIYNCQELKYVFETDTAKTELLPSLIWNFLGEEKLFNEDNDIQLHSMILEARRRSLSSLDTLRISGCHNLEEVFPLLEVNNPNSKGSLSNLVSLYLECIPKLKCIWKGPHQSYCLHKLKDIYLYGCDKLSSLFTTTLARGLLNLQYLSITKCSALETIVLQDDQHDDLGIHHSSTSQTTFQKLSNIDIESCDKLKRILPLSFISHGFPALDRISIQNCAALEEVFGDNRQLYLLESRDIVMKRLQYLALVNLPRLVPSSTFNWHVILTSLARLKIAGTTFNHASNVINARSQEVSNGILPIRMSPTLTYLEVQTESYIYDVEEVFDVDEAQQPVLMELHDLIVGNMPKLLHLWKGPAEFIRPCSLEQLVVKNCPAIKSLFTHSIAQTLYSLKTLIICSCNGLKNIIKPNDYGDDSLNEGCFPDLETLHVSHCQLLESVFPVSMALNFPLLKSLKVEDCPNLKHIFHVDMRSQQRSSTNVEQVPLQLVFNSEELEDMRESGGEEVYSSSDVNYRKSTSEYSSNSTIYSSSDVEYHDTIFSENCCEEIILQNISEPGTHAETVDRESPEVCLPFLKEIQVERCDKLKYLFPLSIARHLPRLKKVCINNASQLEQLFVEDWEGYEGEKLILVPKLKMIIFQELPRFSSLCPPDYVMSFRSILQLPKVFIQNCKMEMIYRRCPDSPNSNTLPQLSHLEQNPRALYCPPVFPNFIVLYQLSHLSFLRHITVNDLKSSPKSLFPNSVVKILQSLEVVEVFSCMGLESIFEPAGEQNNFTILESSSSAANYLPNLITLFIEGCNQLRTIFPLSIAQHLPKLRLVYIKGAHQLEQVFSEDQAYARCKLIELTELSCVHLEELPCLSQIWPAGYAVNSPSFELVLKKCAFREPEKLLNLPNVHLEECNVKVLFDIRQVPSEIQQPVFLKVQRLMVNQLSNLSYLWKGPAELINLSLLQHIILQDCANLQMKSLFTLTTAQTLWSLESIKIVGWKKLENLIEPYPNERSNAVYYSNTLPTCFPRLKSLHLEGCVGIKRIFPLSVAQCLPSLKTVYIKEACQLEIVLYEDREEEYRGSKLIELPQLEILQLVELPCLSRILPAGYALTCPSSANLLLSNYATINLELLLCIHSVCVVNSNMEVMFDLEGEALSECPLSLNLKRLSLSHLPNSVHILKGPTEFIDISQLCYLTIDNSMALGNSLFTFNLAQTLCSLKTLYILNCKNLENIMVPAVNNEGLQAHDESKFSSACFPQLTDLYLVGCDRLRNIFPLSVAQCLPKLRKVTIIGAHQLEQMFFADWISVHASLRKLIELPQLKLLRLEQLPCFSSICPEGYSLSCRPSHLQLQITQCPLLETIKYFPKHPCSFLNSNVPALEFNARWFPPPPGLVTLNIAGAKKSTEGSAGAGGLLRDMYGYWIKGFSYHTASCSAIEAELKAIREGLYMAHDAGYNKVILQLSSESVIDLLKEKSNDYDRLSLITICKNMLLTYHVVQVRFVQLEANKPANWLAFFSFNLETADFPTIISEIPNDLQLLLCQDQLGIVHDPSTSFIKYSTLEA